MEVSHLATVVVDCVFNIVQALPILLKKDEDIVAKLAEDIWTPCMLIADQLLGKTRNPQLTQLLLSLYQEFISICCKLKLSTARDALLNAVRQFCLPAKITADSFSELLSLLTPHRLAGLRAMFFLGIHTHTHTRVQTLTTHTHTHTPFKQRVTDTHSPDSVCRSREGWVGHSVGDTGRC